MYGAKIRAIRGRLGMSQEEFCRFAGVNRYTLSNVESNRNTNPTPGFIESIENALGVSLDDPRIEQFVTIVEFESLAVAA
jgi:transcriptional regulator with XRE-family HTH domain